MQPDHSELKQLEAWVEKAIQKCGEAGFPAGPFAEMRVRWGTKEAMIRCIKRPPENTPLRKLVQAGLGEWSIEQGVLNFPNVFGPEICKGAQWLLDQATGKNGG